jgi:hypothetical protein
MDLCNGAQTRLGAACQAGGAVTLLESFMNSARIVVLATGVFLCVQLASAQDLSRYRGYALASSLESVIASSGSRADRALTLHRRPATIQELEWRAPYSSVGSAAADSVQEISFSFYNDALYQLIVTYDRAKTDGLTNKDLIESLSVTYGTPITRSPGNQVSRSLVLADTIMLAQWENGSASVTLLKDSYSPLFQLRVVSKPLMTLARGAIREAARLDAIDAPRAAAALRDKEAAEEKAALDKTRTENKATFKP